MKLFTHGRLWFKIDPKVGHDSIGSKSLAVFAKPRKYEGGALCSAHGDLWSAQTGRLALEFPVRWNIAHDEIAQYVVNEYTSLAFFDRYALRAPRSALPRSVCTRESARAFALLSNKLIFHARVTSRVRTRQKERLSSRNISRTSGVEIWRKQSPKHAAGAVDVLPVIFLHVQWVSGDYKIHGVMHGYTGFKWRRARWHCPFVIFIAYRIRLYETLAFHGIKIQPGIRYSRGFVRWTMMRYFYNRA